MNTDCPKCGERGCGGYLCLACTDAKTGGLHPSEMCGKDCPGCCDEWEWKGMEPKLPPLKDDRVAMRLGLVPDKRAPEERLLDAIRTNGEVTFECAGCGAQMESIDVWYSGLYCSDECEEAGGQVLSDPPK